MRLKGHGLNSKVEDGDGEVNTRIIHGAQDVIKAEEDLFYSATKTIDSCMTNTRPSLAIALPQIRIAFVNAKKRGIKSRVHYGNNQRKPILLQGTDRACR